MEDDQHELQGQHLPYKHGYHKDYILQVVVPSIRWRGREERPFINFMSKLKINFFPREGTTSKINTQRNYTKTQTYEIVSRAAFQICSFRT